MKSERLKRLELDLFDLEQWMKLGLVPKKELEKHVEEIQAIKEKIEEEKDRLRFLKESGEGEEFIVPKRTQGRNAYTEMPTLPDIDMGEQGGGGGTHDSETETVGGVDNSIISERDADDEDKKTEEEDDDSYFGDKNRWRRGGILDPDKDDW